MKEATTTGNEGNTLFDIDAPYTPKRVYGKKDASGLTGSVLKFVKDDTYFLYHEAEERFRDVFGTYKAFATDYSLRTLLVELEDLADTVQNFFCTGSEMCGDLMEMFIEKVQLLDSYEMIPA